MLEMTIGKLNLKGPSAIGSYSASMATKNGQFWLFSSYWHRKKPLNRHLAHNILRLLPYNYPHLIINISQFKMALWIPRFSFGGHVSDIQIIGQIQSIKRRHWSETTSFGQKHVDMENVAYVFRQGGHGLCWHWGLAYVDMVTCFMLTWGHILCWHRDVA